MPADADPSGGGVALEAGAVSHMPAAASAAPAAT
jgi:hypothetical protein